MTKDSLLPFDLPAVRRRKVTAISRLGAARFDRGGGAALTPGLELGLRHDRATLRPGRAWSAAGAYPTLDGYVEAEGWPLRELRGATVRLALTRCCRTPHGATASCDPADNLRGSGPNPAPATTETDISDMWM